MPVLCTCSRRPLSVSILEALHRTAGRLYSRGGKSKLVSKIEALLRVNQEPTEEQVVSLIEEFNARIIDDDKSNGMLLIIDELGKFLEYAAVNSTRQDVFLLQRLAEAASRSGSQPIMVVCLLHQGFNAYAEQLNQQAQREWEKVAGRFEEIVFNQPVEQVAHLIGSALGVRTANIPRPHVASIRNAMEHALDLSWFGASDRQSMMDLAVHLYPLHATVLPVLIRIFRRFGQNERSLFSFLLSNEPYGLQAFCDKQLRNAQLYRLHDLYDYVRTNFGHRLAVHSYRSHWNLIESVVESYATDDLLPIQILKTVGILNLLNDDLLATEESVLCALTCNDNGLRGQIRKALEGLRNVKRVIYDRGRVRGLCLWPHTSVDVERAYDEARLVVQAPRRVASMITEYLETRPIVARRHYIETGNLRYFDVHHCSVDELSNFISGASKDADGYIVVPLCETGLEHDAAIMFAKTPEIREVSNWLVAVPQPLGNLASLVHEVQRWEWVASNTIELNGDKYAREEVSRQLQAARQQLDASIQTRIGMKHFDGRTSLEWFHRGQLLSIRDGRHLLSELSRVCDQTYSEAPRIQNELVNRRNLSSAAAAARMRLIEKMFSDGKSPWLAMNPDKKPPEMSMYLSVLHNTGIHEEHGGIWRIQEPQHRRDENSRVMPSLKKILDVVRMKPGARVNVAALFSDLRKPPYGVRDGVIPLLLTVFAIAHEHDVAFYKNGTFVREMTGEIMLELIKAPERFEIQYCEIAGVRAEIFEKLLGALDLKPHTERKTDLLDVVKPLCTFVAKLPTYVHNTKKRTPVAIGVRDAIMSAREPSALLFADLPNACGVGPFSAQESTRKDVQAYIRHLRAALDELRATYPELQDRMRKALREVFDLPGSFQQFRITLAGRAKQTVLGVSEPKLRAFCLRLMDDNLAEPGWLESLGSFLALKPPAKWLDAEEDLFVHELAQMAERFHRVESIAFSNGTASQGGVGIRLAITQANGNECEKVIHYGAEEEYRLRELQAQFEAIFSKDKRLALAAASRAIWSNLEKGDA